MLLLDQELHRSFYSPELGDHHGAHTLLTHYHQRLTDAGLTPTRPADNQDQQRGSPTT
ncbi:hypothetical protein [Micromonospora fluostatini]|uniref:hypothetical protein n=1 Tax=Micromonospora sp. JCM 30529 TaxID=3421643 RepID=UPI003D17C884